MKNNKLPLLPYFPSLFVGPATALFLSGRIIEYPQGTREGGIVGAIGVAVIILSSILITVLARYLQKKGHRNDSLE